MESIDVVENPIENSKQAQDTIETETDENFQKFIYELFEKNGVINDLRAYLRGHIVDVLKKAQTGDTPACQKNFTQRLDLTYQALNMLVAEYLLSMDFNYSLSVFLSEIPLANMVFDYSQNLLHNNQDNGNLRFKESDVWSILNYLGIKCDSEHALNIIKMYNGDERISLMLCLLKCIPMYKSESHETAMEQENSTTVSVCSSKSFNITADDTKSFHKTQSHRDSDKCKHYAICKPCQQKYKKAKELYREKKHNISKAETKQALFNMVRSKSFLKDISIIEQELINEMFEELKSVYEAEVAMAKAEEEKRVKKSLVSHAMQLKQHRDEMEQTFRQREAELERSVQQKKKFLWGLARALREQHAALARAVHAVRQETRRLSDKEESLKSQLLDAERVMAKRGEEMRAQISEELAILETHLDSMKRERETIDKERSHLEQLKVVCECSSNVVKANTTEVREDLRSHYDLLKNELGILKKYLDCTKFEAKCVIERSTMTEVGEEASKTTIVLNNEQEAERCPSYLREEDRCARTPNQLVNDFKKPKNVNFDQVMQSAEDMFPSEEPVSGANDGDAELSRQRDVIALLTAENMRLRDHAQQYREQMEELARLQARLRAHTPPPAPPPFPAHSFSAHMHRTSSSRGGLIVANGAGEQLSILATGRPRVVLPTDTVPFIGALAGDVKEHRRHLLSQWRALRKRASLTNDASFQRPHARPCSAGAGAAASPPRREPETEPAHPYSYEPAAREHPAGRVKTPLVLDTPRHREKSPKTVLKEVKGKLRNKDSVKGAPVKREKSPNSVLREAKLRLRKLEIEAEAVEKSYLDFRKRQSELRDDGQGYAEDGIPHAAANEEAVVTKDIGGLDIRHSSPVQSSLPENRLETHSTKSYYNDSQAMKAFDKYLREYHTNLDFGDKYLQFHNLSVTAAKPIPDSFSEIHKEPIKEKQCENFNYLETPLTEFRKLYHAHKPSGSCKIIDNARNDRTRSEILSNLENVQDVNDLENIHDATKLMEDTVNHEQFEAIKNALLKEKKSKTAELEILRRNINKIYDLKDTPATLTPDKNSLGDRVSKAEPSNVDMINKHKDNSEHSKLRIEIETVSQTNTMKVTNAEPENVTVIVESSVIATKVAASESEGDARHICPNMTILISPKRSIDTHAEDSEASLEGTPERSKRSLTPERSKRSLSPEQAALLTRNDVLDAIFHGDPMKESLQSLQQEQDGAREDSISDIGKYPTDEYPDDFSADVDNYDTRNPSPISLPKTDEDSFW